MQLNKTTIKEILASIPEKSSLYNYLKWLSKENTDYSAYEKLSKENLTDCSLFLSIVMRTQGKRPEALQEVLSKVASQTYQNFELILLAHKLTESNEVIVKSIIENLPISLKSKIRYYIVNEGNRTTPLNYGFAYSKGKYIAILDDDDLVYDNWIEEFYKASLENEGKLLHALCEYQNWSSTFDGTKNVLKCESAKKLTDLSTAHENKLFSNNYDYINELFENCCPPVSLAFPSFVFKSLNIHFDESLSTAEDWDFILRTVNVCGYKNINKFTSIYRNWINSENSHTLHSDEEWNDNYATIKKKMSECAKLLPNDYDFSEIYSYFFNKHIYSLNKDKVKLYTSVNKKFNEELAVIKYPEVFEDGFKIEFTTEDLNDTEIKFIRFDPTDYGKIILKDFSCTILFENNKERIFNLNSCRHAGMELKNKVYYPLDDPYLILKLPKKKKIISIKFTYRIDRELSETDSDEISKKLKKFQMSYFSFFRKC